MPILNKIKSLRPPTYAWSLVAVRRRDTRMLVAAAAIADLLHSTANFSLKPEDKINKKVMLKILKQQKSCGSLNLRSKLLRPKIRTRNWEQRQASDSREQL